jgi:hypothetical protein
MELVGAKSGRQHRRGQRETRHRRNCSGTAGRCRRNGCRRRRLAGAGVTLAPTIYSAPTPAPLAPPINPGPAVVPPAGLSPLLTVPGPIYPTPEREMPAYPSPQYPGSIGDQNMQAYRNRLLLQQWRRDRTGISPGSEQSREIQQLLNQMGPR